MKIWKQNSLSQSVNSEQLPLLCEVLPPCVMREICRCMKRWEVPWLPKTVVLFQHQSLTEQILLLLGSGANSPWSLLFGGRLEDVSCGTMWVLQLGLGAVSWATVWCSGWVLLHVLLLQGILLPSQRIQRRCETRESAHAWWNDGQVLGCAVIENAARLSFYTALRASQIREDCLNEGEK